MDRLMALKRGGGQDPEFGRTLMAARPTGSGGRRGDAAPDAVPARSPEVETDNPVYVPPFIGTRVVKGIALDEVASWLNETALFRNQWQFRPQGGEKDDEFKARLRPVLREELAKATAAGILVPQVVYGYFHANGEGNDLVVWKDETRTSEWLRFSFPREPRHPYRNIADLFRPVESGDVDYVAFHLVTMGAAVSQATAALFQEDRYQEYLLLHGLGVEMAEALAEYWHLRIRQEWGFADQDGSKTDILVHQGYRGGRYSFGYPACPDLEDNLKIADLLGAERIGVVVSEDFQYEPEQTTSALISHHPKAKYFVAR
jgi:5-methyltetrahydrofolate--homocysteine methyltransferase